MLKAHPSGYALTEKNLRAVDVEAPDCQPSTHTLRPGVQTYMEVFHVLYQKRRLSLIILVTIGCLALCDESSTAKASSASGFGPATYPMSRSEFFGRINSRLVASCDVSRDEYNLDRDKCLQLITQRTTSRDKTVLITSTIEDKTQFKTYGRA